MARCHLGHAMLMKKVAKMGKKMQADKKTHVQKMTAFKALAIKVLKLNKKYKCDKATP